MAKLTNSQIARAIYLATHDKRGNELEEVLKNTTQVLYKKRLLSKSKDIVSELEKIWSREHNVVKAKITSAHKLKEGHHREVVHLLKEWYKAKEVNLEEERDEKLLSGFKIEVGDELIDASLQSKLRKLKEHLINTQ